MKIFNNALVRATNGDEIKEDDEVVLLIEIRGIYDGWSVAKMKDGRLVNRWPEDDRRHKPTQNWISNQIVEGE